MPATSVGIRYQSRHSFLQISIEEFRDIGERFLGLWRIDVELVLRMRLTFIDVKIGNDAGATQFTMRTNRIAEEQIARARCQDGRREAFEVAVDRRDVGIFEVR